MGNTGGSVFKRGDGRWCGKAIINGKPCYINPCHNFGRGNKTSLPAVKRTAKALTREQVDRLIETARDTR